MWTLRGYHHEFPSTGHEQKERILLLSCLTFTLLSNFISSPSSLTVSPQSSTRASTQSKGRLDQHRKFLTANIKDLFTSENHQVTAWYTYLFIDTKLKNSKYRCRKMCMIRTKRNEPQEASIFIVHQPVSNFQQNSLS